MDQQETDAIKKELVVFFHSFQQECQNLANSVDHQLQQSLQNQRSELSNIAREQIQQGLGEAVNRYHQQLDQAEHTLANKIRQLEQGLEEVNRKNKQLVTRSWLAVSLCLGVLVIGAAYLLYHYKSEIEANKTTADMTKIINQSDLTLCGNRLCAAVSSEKHGKYRVVNPR